MIDIYDDALTEAFHYANGHKGQVAKLLGVSRAKIYRDCKILEEKRPGSLILKHRAELAPHGVGGETPSPVTKHEAISDSSLAQEANRG